MYNIKDDSEIYQYNNLWFDSFSIEYCLFFYILLFFAAAIFYAAFFLYFIKYCQLRFISNFFTIQKLAVVMLSSDALFLFVGHGKFWLLQNL